MKFSLSKEEIEHLLLYVISKDKKIYLRENDP